MLVVRNRNIFEDSYFCQVCRNASVTNELGNYACDECCYFFENAVLQRAEFWCMFYGCCPIYGIMKYNCSFCWLKSCFKAGLLAERVRFGWSGNSFLEETKFQRLRVPTRIVPDDEGLCQIKALARWFHSLEKSFRISQPQYLFLNRYKQFRNQYMRRRFAIGIAINSMLWHGNILLKRCFIDPYKCRVSSVQNMTVEILKMTELLKDYRNEGFVIGENLIKKLTYFKRLDRRNLKIRILQLRLNKIEEYMVICMRDMHLYAPEAFEEE